MLLVMLVLEKKTTEALSQSSNSYKRARVLSCTKPKTILKMSSVYIGSLALKEENRK